MKQQMRALETKVTALRADADRLEERLEAMELNAAVAARGERRHASRATEERPPLKVIRLSPDEEAPADNPPAGPAEPAEEPEGKRPVIRGKGDNVIKTGASVQWRRTGLAGKSEDVAKAHRPEASVARLSPPFPGIPATRRVFGQE